ncbi:hypothetical protein IVA95_16190 [Bradyrhizobium sp. 157]|uniref:hypothetical protein n=1 Tax=Bradyrhizobium sp. 157 TaxID=2782631 RepID=UPI001FFB9DD4|nr:hypothetical protein [Bradyrhizobium sp. 157]MCK1639101.1 hypothetical protein [Bradyrhizobium sp. 157]
MLQRSTTLNAFQLFGHEMRQLYGDLMSYAVTVNVNPNTLKSQKLRDRRKANRRDPIDFYNVPLRRSHFNRHLAAFEQAMPLEARALSLDDKRWRDNFAKVVLQTILEDWTITPPRTRR